KKTPGRACPGHSRLKGSPAAVRKTWVPGTRPGTRDFRLHGIDLAAGFTSQANVMIGSVTGSQGHETSLIAGVIDAARASTFFPGSVRQPGHRAGVSVEGVGGGGRCLSPGADRPHPGQQAATV